jgi:FixJ family two-component response regulator
MVQIVEASETKSAPRVGIVDDDESMREALQSLLKSIGFCPTIYASACGFLSAAEHFDLDCLIIDVRMPEMDGFQLQQRLIEENCRVPIVFISAHSEQGIKDRAIAAGAIDFLQKPFGENALLNAIELASKAKKK